MLSFNNVNNSAGFCLERLFPRLVRRFTREVEMSLWAPVKGSAPLTVPQPDLRHRREEFHGLTLSKCPGSPFSLTSSTQQQPPQRPPHSSQICPRYGWHVLHRCPSGGRWIWEQGDVWLSTAVGYNFTRCPPLLTFSRHQLDAFYTPGKYFLNTKLI